MPDGKGVQRTPTKSRGLVALCACVMVVIKGLSLDCIDLFGLVGEWIPMVVGLWCSKFMSYQWWIVVYN